MDQNELKDRGDQRWLIGWMGFFAMVVALIGTFLLLHYNQGPLLADIVKIVLGFLGGTGAGVVLGGLRRQQ